MPDSRSERTLRAPRRRSQEQIRSREGKLPGSLPTNGSADRANVAPGCAHCATIRLPAAKMMRAAIFFLSLVLATAIAGGNAVPVHSATISGIARNSPARYRGPSEDSKPAKPSPQIIVIGFIGGFVRH